MIINNFFNEDLEVETTSTEIESKIEEKYNISKNMQSIYKHKGNVYLILKKEEKIKIVENKKKQTENKIIFKDKDIIRNSLKDIDEFVNSIDSDEGTFILENSNQYIINFLN